LVGGGVKLSKANEELIELGNLLKIPIFPTWNALDTVPSDYEYYGGRVGTYGGAGRNFGIQNCDLLISIGSRISGRLTGGNVKSFCREAKKYLVDIDLALLEPKNQQLAFDVCIYADAKLFINNFMKAIKIDNELPQIDFTDWMQKVILWKTKYDPVVSEYFNESELTNPYAFLRILSQLMPNNAIIIPDCGGNLVLTNHAFETKRGQMYFSSNGNSPMGFSFAGAIGAWFASDKEQPVISIIGDGGFNMNLQELQVLKNYNIKTKNFIINNHIYGITKAFQEINFYGRAEACGPKGYNPPNFINVCKAYDIETVQIRGNSRKYIEQAITYVLDYDGPIVCDVDCHEWHVYEPKIVGWNTPIEDMYPYLPEDEFLSNMIIKPLDTYQNRVYPTVDGKINK